MDKGIYCLVLENPACTVQDRGARALHFEAGWHATSGLPSVPVAWRGLNATSASRPTATGIRHGISITC